jgi:hypothetical protein
MYRLAFRPRGFIDTASKIYDAVNVDTQFQKTCACNLKTNHSITWAAYKTTKGAYANISQKQKYAAFVRRTQHSTTSNYDNIQFQFRNL